MKKLPPKTIVIAIVMCFLGFVLALMGAEFPADTSLIEALPFWMTVSCTAAFLLTTADTAIGQLFEDIQARPFLKTCISGGVTILLVTLPMSLMCLPIDALLPDSDSVFETSPTADPLSSFFLGWADQYLNQLPAVTGLWLFVNALDFAFPAAHEAPVQKRVVDEPGDPLTIETADSDNDQQTQKPSALERRFPEIMGRKLLAIEADEHYVQLHTDAGSTHVLYRFRDALRDVEDLSGLRVHRSWWVARSAVETLTQTGSGFGLKLKTGLTVPVSQTYRRDVERMIETGSNPG